MSRIALFSSTIFSTCFVRVSSSSPSSLDAMDRYLPKPKQKNIHEITKLGPAVCILGKTGLGKTWLVNHSLEKFVELTPDILRSKHETIEFLTKIKNSDLPVVLDEYECVNDLIGIREITEPPTKGLFVIVSQVPVKFDFEINVYQMPVKTPEEIKKLFPKADPQVIAACDGDLRIVSQSIVFKSDARDDFQGPRDFLISLVSKKSDINPAHYIGHPIQEPGNIASILHENYPDSKGDHAIIIDLLSQADVIETRVYGGDWELLQYFNLWGCILPSVEIAHTLPHKLRPGSTWTKYQNACMRGKRIEAMANRIPGKRLSHDELLTLRDYAENENAEILKEYGIQPQDIDVLNHMSPLRKIKTKTVGSLKKCLAAVQTAQMST